MDPITAVTKPAISPLMRAPRPPDSVQRDRTAGIAAALAHDVPGWHRWCTPSVIPGPLFLGGPAGSDVSISAGEMAVSGGRVLGTPAEHSGLFRDAEVGIADAYCADRAIVSVNGTSGSNWVLMRMLALTGGSGPVLVARNAHHSALNAAKALGVDFCFLPGGCEPAFEAPLPPTADDVAAALCRHPEAAAVMITSPTYEGVAARISEIAAVVRSHPGGPVLIVDQAWGAHLAFHPALPDCALRLGADIVVQSTHKQGGSLQQTGVILWNEARVDSDLLEQSQREYATTSPSFHLIASVESAVRTLAADGERLLGRSLARIEALRARLAELAPQLSFFHEDAELPQARCAGLDATKLTLSVSRYMMSGGGLEAALNARGIVCEKSSPGTLTLLATFQLAEAAVEDTAHAIGEELAAAPLRLAPARSLPDPFGAMSPAPLVSPGAVSRAARAHGRLVPLAAAVGLVAAELVEAYPPGIPILAEGFEITPQAIDYLVAARDAGTRIAARDPSLKAVLVIDPADLS